MQGSKTVDQALSVLLALEERPLTASGCAEATGLNRTVVHRMLPALQRHGFVHRENDLYRLGYASLRFAERVEPALRAAAGPAMRALARNSGETVVLSVTDHMDTVAIEQVRSQRHPLRAEYELGSRRPIEKGASGRAILAFRAKGEIARILRASSEPEALAAKLDEVRQRGFALSHDELQAGVHGIAVPVHAQEKVVASLGIIVPSQRSDDLLEHADALLRASREISQNLPLET